MDEEVVLLEEQLASAHADIERLQTRLAEVEATASSREAEAVDLRRQLDAAKEELADRDAALSTQAADNEALASAGAAAAERAKTAAQRYREAVLTREPELPADLVVGETVEEIDESLDRARQTVAQVRQHLEQQAQALRVPAGAPARSAPDLSALSPTEKIRLGLSQT